MRCCSPRHTHNNRARHRRRSPTFCRTPAAPIVTCLRERKPTCQERARPARSSTRARRLSAVSSAVHHWRHHCWQLQPSMRTSKRKPKLQQHFLCPLLEELRPSSSPRNLRRSGLQWGPTTQKRQRLNLCQCNVCRPQRRHRMASHKGGRRHDLRSRPSSLHLLLRLLPPPPPQTHRMLWSPACRAIILVELAGLPAL